MARIRKPPHSTRSRDLLRKLRSHTTDAEQNLWYHLRAGRMQGLKWRRQHPLHPHVVDFYCHELQLVVELDGGQHGEAVDAARTAALERQGLRVLRFWNHQVLLEMDAVLDAIWNCVGARTLSPSPSPGGRGEQEQGPVR
jgi:very-short-patch-repair endonuclease